MTGVNDVPVEVLGYIFYLATVDNMYPYSRLGLGRYLSVIRRNPYRNCAPFVFLQVCGHWRAVAEATPILWTPLDATTQTLSPTTLVALRHWLSLSQPAPLEFFLDKTNRFVDARKGDASAHVAAMLRVLANEAHRWRSAALDMDPHVAGVFVDMLLNEFHPGSFPNLKRLEIVAFPGNSASVPLEDLARAIGSVESLKELYLEMKYVPSLLSDIPWGQLTTVYLGMPLSINEVTSLLTQATAAIEATFGRISGAPTSTWDAQRSTLPELKNLTLTGSESLFNLFNRFDFPRLEQLTITSDSLTCHQPLEGLIEQPGLPFHRLVLRVSGRLSVSDLTKYLGILKLRRVPHVEFHSWNILDVISGVAQLEDDIPALWSWRHLRRSQCVGWKSQFDHNDSHVARIMPSPHVVS
ncbi:hypothetical protein D9619_005048 [Psilocybe cf. subviscida]|uniref:F-box domain-containing protein n=1 Tax=Psilocybe cf. subviscida TaxID=2480587 RepID=A0A8H5BPE8_9AGAR|nr:hypothetical protein D9619_005048 [Psilocybe cf. subviscida]